MILPDLVLGRPGALLRNNSTQSSIPSTGCATTAMRNPQSPPQVALLKQPPSTTHSTPFSNPHRPRAQAHNHLPVDEVGGCDGTDGPAYFRHQLLPEPLAGWVVVAVAECDECVDGLALDWVVHGHHCRLGAGRMPHQRTLHLSGADAVAAHLGGQGRGRVSGGAGKGVGWGGGRTERGVQSEDKGTPSSSESAAHSPPFMVRVGGNNICASH